MVLLVFGCSDHVGITGVKTQVGTLSHSAPQVDCEHAVKSKHADSTRWNHPGGSGWPQMDDYEIHPKNFLLILHSTKA